MKLSEVFEEAARRVEIAWRQDTPTGQNDPGGDCAHLTLTSVVLDIPICNLSCLDSAHRISEYDAFEILARACGGDGSTMDPVWAWNDAPERTKAEVVAMFRALAATERAREGGLVIIKEETPALRSTFAPVFISVPKQEKQP